MKILIVGINFYPELTGIGKYTGEMSSWLSGQGHEVRVVTAPPYYPAWKTADGYSSAKYKRHIFEGATIWRCPLYVPRRPTGIKRILHLGTFALTSFPLIVSQSLWRPDVVFCIEPTALCAPASLLTAKLCRAKAVLHVQDFEVDAAFQLGILKCDFLRKSVSFFEKVLMRVFDGVTTISTNMLERLVAKGVDDKRCDLFPNWVDAQAIYPLGEISPMRRDLGIGDDVVVALYSGNFGEKQGLELLVDVAKALQAEENILFVFCGEGANYKNLQVLSRGLNNIKWLPLQPYEKLNELLNVADIHLLPQRADAADLVMPSKLTGMFASGRPIIATAHESTQVAKVVAGKGAVVPPGDVPAFVEALKVLSSCSLKRKSMGKEGRQFAENELHKESVLTRFESFLSALTNG